MIDDADAARILRGARNYLATHPYQTRFFAALDTGHTEVFRDNFGNKKTRRKWVACSPTGPHVMLSLRGAIIRAAGSAPLAWEVFEVMTRHGFNIRNMSEPATRERALELVDECIRLLNRRRARAKPVQPALANA